METKCAAQIRAAFFLPFLIHVFTLIPNFDSQILVNLWSMFPMIAEYDIILNKSALNKEAKEQNIKLSIVTPFFRDDPSAWILALLESKNAKNCEIILVDDGSLDANLIELLTILVQKWPGPAYIVRLKQNQGRSIARNRGIDLAKGEYVLFIDADMVPQKTDFLEKYFEIIEKKSAAIVFGGFVTNEDVNNKETALHHHLSKIGDCRPLCDRKNLGAYAVASNNLMVRRQLINAHRFDDGFKGWGWEDTEWAFRAVLNGYGLVHIDNPAVHIGLDSSQTMLKKYKEAGPNLAHMLAKHPLAGKFRAVKAARIVGNLPFHKFLRPIIAKIVLNQSNIFPMGLRRIAIIFWRASWAADAISNENNNKLAN